MATIQLNSVENFLSFTPFPQTGPGASVRFRSEFAWTPVDRPDLPSQRTSISDTIAAGHPAATAALDLQDAAEALLNARLTDFGQSQATTPVSKLNVWWRHAQPFDGSSPLVVNWKAICAPVEYPEITLILQGSETIPPGAPLMANFVTFDAAARANAATRYPDFTLTLPEVEEEP
jgi:hypothetical protein